MRRLRSMGRKLRLEFPEANLQRLVVEQLNVLLASLSDEALLQMRLLLLYFCECFEMTGFMFIQYLLPAWRRHLQHMCLGTLLKSPAVQVSKDPGLGCILSSLSDIMLSKRARGPLHQQGKLAPCNRQTLARPVDMSSATLCLPRMPRRLSVNWLHGCVLGRMAKLT